jgi:small subunit ribosomal protein S16
MLKIRLQRVGRKNDASFRVVVTESQRGPKAGKVVEKLGSYDPKRDVSEIKKDRVLYWMSVGAQASGTVHNLLVSNKIIDAKKVNVLPKKTAPVKEVEEVKEEAPKAEAPAEEVVVEEAAPEAPAEEAK